MLSWNDILVTLPEIYLVVAVCVLLLVDVCMRAQSRNVTHWLAAFITVVTMALVIAGQPAHTETAFDGMFIRDTASEIIKLFTLLSVLLVFLFSRPYLRDRNLHIGEFYSLMLFATVGIMLLSSAGNLMTVYLGLELMSLPSFALVAMNRDSRLSSEAAIKFFVLGAVASGMLLYGMSLIYGAAGTLDLAQLHSIGLTDVAHNNMLLFGVIFMLVGIAFELGVAPFHMWLPDVYHGAPTPITTFIASASKLAAFALAWRLLETGMGALSPQWQIMLAAMAALSLAIGNLVAIVQTNIKRMLAYSTISHMGYLLLGLANATPEGYSAALFYAVCYALMATASFGVLLALAHAGFECEEIDDFKGLNRRSPWMAFMMLLAMFSLAGVPPLWGFFAKVLVLQAAIDAGMLWLAIVGIVFAIIGLFYYLRVVKVMYFDPPQDSVDLTVKPDPVLRWTLSLNALALLGLGVFWGPLLDWCRQAFFS